MSALKALIRIYDKRVTAQRGWFPHGRKPPMPKLSGVCYSRMSNWKNGKTGARLDLFEAMANTLGYRVVLQDIETGRIIGND
ncbi:MAG: hypothetical protein KIS86_06360 [Devosia sp.]|nr:hypothetical protein [Devosia sp.]